MAKGVPITADQVRQYRLAVHHLDRAYGEEQMLIVITIVIETRLQGKHEHGKQGHPSDRF